MKNCNLKTTEGPGIYINNCLNTVLNNITITNSKNGVLITNSKNITIENSIIKSNSIGGISIGNNVTNSLIYNNTIHANNYIGIYYGSCINTTIKNNKITENRDNITDLQRANNGAGVYIDNNITNMVVEGNYFLQNGEYGIFNNYVVKNLVNQNVQKINNNYFINHKQRVIFTQANEQGGTETYLFGVIIMLWKPS